MAVKVQKRTPQELQLLGGSCLFYGGPGRWAEAALCVISAQPLADVVANYTCQNRDNKGDNVLCQSTHPLSAGGAQRCYCRIFFQFLQLQIRRNSMVDSYTVCGIMTVRHK